MTKATISYHESDSQSYAAMIAVKSALTHSDIPDDVLELVYLRVSQLNGCRYCIRLLC